MTTPAPDWSTLTTHPGAHLMQTSALFSLHTLYFNIWFCLVLHFSIVLSKSKASQTTGVDVQLQGPQSLTDPNTCFTTHCQLCLLMCSGLEDELNLLKHTH